MGFENDIFISYAHEDNQPIPPEDKGWVDQFEAALRAYLGKTAGDPPRIWRDPTLERSGNLDHHITTHLLQSAILLCIVSRSYVRSPYCRDELNQFLREFGDDKRVVKVVTASLSDERQHPPPLNKSLGYPFFEVDEKNHLPYELDPDDEASRRVYRRLLYDLAREVAERLEAINGSQREPVATVYLASTSFDLNEQRAALRSELEQHAIAVLPDQALPILAADCEAAVNGWLERSALAVHLIGKYGGGAPDGPRDESYVELQHRLAIGRGQAAGPGFGRLLYLVPEIAAEDQDHVRFVTQLKDDPATYQKGDLIQGSFEEFKAAVLRHALDAAKPAAPSAEAQPARPVRVYLVYDAADEDAVAPIDTFLSSRGFEVRLPVFDGDEASRHRDHTQALSQSDWAIVYWGAAGEAWFNEAVSGVRNWQALGRETPLSAAVCFGPPANRRKDRAAGLPRPEPVLSVLAGFAEEGLEPFLRAARPGGKTASAGGS